MTNTDTFNVRKDDKIGESMDRGENETKTDSSIDWWGTFAQCLQALLFLIIIGPSFIGYLPFFLVAIGFRTVFVIIDIVYPRSWSKWADIVNNCFYFGSKDLNSVSEEVIREIAGYPMPLRRGSKLANMWYRLRNEHPLLSLFLCEINHPFCPFERMGSFFLLNVYSYAMAYWVRNQVLKNHDDSINSIWFSFVVIVIPSLILTTIVREIALLAFKINDLEKHLTQLSLERSHSYLNIQIKEFDLMTKLETAGDSKSNKDCCGECLESFCKYCGKYVCDVLCDQLRAVIKITSKSIGGILWSASIVVFVITFLHDKHQAAQHGTDMQLQSFLIGVLVNVLFLSFLTIIGKQYVKVLLRSNSRLRRFVGTFVPNKWLPSIQTKNKHADEEELLRVFHIYAGKYSHESFESADPRDLVMTVSSIAKSLNNLPKEIAPRGITSIEKAVAFIRKAASQANIVVSNSTAEESSAAKNAENARFASLSQLFVARPEVKEVLPFDPKKAENKMSLTWTEFRDAFLADYVKRSSIRENLAGVTFLHLFIPNLFLCDDMNAALPHRDNLLLQISE